VAHDLSSDEIELRVQKILGEERRSHRDTMRSFEQDLKKVNNAKAELSIENESYKKRLSSLEQEFKELSLNAKRLTSEKTDLASQFY